MKKIYLIILVLGLVVMNGALFEAKSEAPEDILQKATSKILEQKQAKDKKTEVIESGEIIFRVKRTNLWLKEKPRDKKPDEFAEAVLLGKLYSPLKEIQMVEKKEDVDRSTVENAIASVFSANRSGDLDWISDNFTDTDKQKIKTLFKNKKVLEESKSDAEKIISIYIIGQADYKGAVLVFVQENYVDGRKLKESLACKETEKGWKVTNEFSKDKTFDIVFAALSSGEFSLKGKELLKKEVPVVKDSKS